MFHEIEYRQTKRNAYCSICGKVILKDTDKVITFTSIKGHMDTQHICKDCLEAINKCYETGETIDTVK